MRMGMIIAGLLFIVLGAAAFMGKLDFTQDKEVLKIGELSATVQEEKSIPQWAGGAGVLIGLGLLVAGAMRKN